MIILPAFIGRDIGKQLYVHCLKKCRSDNIMTLNIMADPHAKGFYDKMGATYIDDYPSSITGRNICVF